MEDNYLAKWLEDEYQEGNPIGRDMLSKHMDMLSKMDVQDVDKQTLFDSIQDEIKRKERDLQPISIKLVPITRWVISIAAAFVVLFACVFLLRGDEIIEVSKNEIVSHLLPDKSEITLNENSRISYTKEFDSRIIDLEGEAFFEVEKGSSFKVNTPNGLVEVLGTSFNVFARETYLVVSCKTGKVSVAKGTQSIVLIPGERAIVTDTNIIKDNITVAKIDKWVEGESTFEKMPMSIMTSSLKSQFNLSIHTNSIDLDALIFTGSYVHDDLDKALKMVFGPMSIKYKFINKNKIELFK